MTLSLKIKIKDIHHCKETDHVHATVRTNPRGPYRRPGSGGHHLPRGPYRRPGSSGHHLSDPWIRLSTLGY